MAANWVFQRLASLLYRTKLTDATFGYRLFPTPLVQRILAALTDAELLPRTPVTPLLFDDLNPALAAAVAGDATPEEAIAGVRRGWHRLEAAP